MLGVPPEEIGDRGRRDERGAGGTIRSLRVRLRSRSRLTRRARWSGAG